jgi:multiple sugar transport system permease protein
VRFDVTVRSNKATPANVSQLGSHWLPNWWYSLHREEVLTGYLFIAPTIIGLLVFTAGPILMAALLSFTSWDLITPPEWVGFGNYLRAYNDELFVKSMGNTVYYTLGTVPVGVFLSLLLAIAMNQKLHGIVFYRTLYFLPIVSSIVTISLLWTWIYYPDFGILNYLLRLVGLDPINWLQSSAWAMPAIIIMSIWAGLGYNMVILLAGLQGIPEELYDAAHIDGAGHVQTFWYITIPMLSPVIFFVVVLSLIGSFQVFSSAYVMTQGGPLNSTLTIVYLIFNQGFRYFRMGYSSALAVVLAVVILVLTLIQLRLQSRWIYYE